MTSQGKNSFGVSGLTELRNVQLPGGAGREGVSLGRRGDCGSPGRFYTLRAWPQLFDDASSATASRFSQRAQRGSDYCESAFWKKAATAPAAPATTMTAHSSSAMSSARPAGVIGFFICEETVSSCTVVKKKA